MDEDLEKQFKEWVKSLNKLGVKASVNMVFVSLDFTKNSLPELTQEDVQTVLEVLALNQNPELEDVEIPQELVQSAHQAHQKIFNL